MGCRTLTRGRTLYTNVYADIGHQSSCSSAKIPTCSSNYEHKRTIIGKNTRLISNVFCVNFRYIQSCELVNINNTLDTKVNSIVNMIKELRDTLQGRFDMVGFSNDELNYIVILVL